MHLSTLGDFFVYAAVMLIVYSGYRESLDRGSDRTRK